MNNGAIHFGSKSEYLNEESTRRNRCIEKAKVNQAYNRRWLQANSIYAPRGIKDIKVVIIDNMRKLTAKNQKGDIIIYSPEKNTWSPVSLKTEQAILHERGEEASSKSDQVKKKLDDLIAPTPEGDTDEAQESLETETPETIDGISETASEVRKTIESMLSPFEMASKLIEHLKDQINGKVKKMLKEMEKVKEELLELTIKRNQLKVEVERLERQKNAHTPSTINGANDHQTTHQSDAADQTKETEENETTEEIDTIVVLDFEESDKLTKKAMPTKEELHQHLEKLKKKRSDKEYQEILNYTLKQFELIMRSLPVEETFQEDIDKISGENRSQSDLREEIKCLMTENTAFRKKFGMNTFPFYSGKRVFDTIWKWEGKKKGYDYNIDVDSDHNQDIIHETSNRLIDLISLLEELKQG